MRLIGLTKDVICHIPAKYNGDLVSRTETHAIGGGEWSIEVYDDNNTFLKEFVGSNGTRDEEADDLWAAYDAWAKEVVAKAYSYQSYKAPDGTIGSYKYFIHEMMHGRLHGCILAV